MELSLFLCGDVMLGRGIDQILRHPSHSQLYEAYADTALAYVHLAEEAHGRIPRHVDPAYVWGDALEVLRVREPDARIINLETAVTTSNTPWPKGINYRMHPANIRCLTVAQIDCCVLANNHVLDWGLVGLRETLATLRRTGIQTAGAGQQAAEAATPAVVPLVQGGRVLTYGFASTTSGIPREWAATDSQAGVNLLPDLSAQTAASLAEMARVARKPGDVLVASLHWGGNCGYDVPHAQRAFAHALIDGGFSIVHGHSSHHAKGIELYRGRLILYGCGDFINDYEGISGYEEFRSDLALMYLPRLDEADLRLVSLEVIPMQMRCFRLNRPSNRDAAWLFQVLARESAKLGTVLVRSANGSFCVESDSATFRRHSVN